jgi:hypothetical protein
MKMKLDKYMYMYAIIVFGLLININIGFASAAATGGLGVAILPKISSVSLGSQQIYSIKIVSTENFDDTLRVYLTTDEKNVTIPAWGTVQLQTNATIPEGIATGIRAFKVVAESSRQISANDTGLINITQPVYT